MLVRAAPFAAFIFCLAAFPGAPLARGVAAAVLLLAFWRRYGELRLPLAWRDTAISIGVGLAVFAAWIALDVPWATFGGERAGFAPLEPGGAIDWMSALPRLAVLVAVVPLMEELFWRSFLMRWIDARDFLGREPRRASLTAVALSSGLFAVEHSMWAAGMIAGLAYAGLYMTTNNLRAPVVAHVVTNALLGSWILATGRWHLW